MSASTISTVQGACYGFVNSAPILSVDARWGVKTQRPFRGYWLWCWGTGELLTLELGGHNALEMPASLEHFDRGVAPEAFLAYVDVEHPEAFKRHDLVGTAVRSDILGGFGHEALPLPSLGVGVDVSWTYRGLVRGIVLVGIQIP